MGGSVLRVVGRDHEPKRFSVFGPIAIAKILDLHATLRDRSITIPMRHRARDRHRQCVAVDQLSTRLPVRVHLESLDVAQVDGYLRDRMKTAGCEQEVFSEDAVLCIREATGGVLRKIDVLAYACLEAVSERKGKLLDGKAVQDAVQVCAEALR